MQTFVLNHGTDIGRDLVLQNAHAALDALPKSRRWRITIKQAVTERTSKQNRALFGLAYKLLTVETGFTVDELHAAFCKRFFGTVTLTFAGETIERPFRTTTTDENGDDDTISTEEFARFYNMVQQVGGEAGVDIPEPDPLYKMQGRWAE